jgi:hypothetical protein
MVGCSALSSTVQVPTALGSFEFFSPIENQH